MRKILKAVGLLLAVLIINSAKVQANEGRIVLENKGVRCEGISVWQDGRYKLLGKCYGLEYPYKGEYDRYYLWVRDANKQVDKRVVEVNRGYFAGFMTNKFSQIWITAEKMSGPRKPSNFVIASGSLQTFVAPEGRMEVVKTDSTAEDKVVKQNEDVNQKIYDVDKTEQEVKTSSVSVGKILGKIVVSILVIVLVVIGIVIVGSLVFRKRGSVS